jgi:hypothetical protein
MIPAAPRRAPRDRRPGAGGRALRAGLDLAVVPLDDARVTRIALLR